VPLRHFRSETDADGILWLSIDKQGSGANTLSDDVVGELESVLDALEAHPPRALVIRSAKDKGFVAGADIAEFVGLGEADGCAKVRRVQRAFDRIEALPLNTASLVHGYCLGGGLEVALATRARIARDDATFGAPEVTLGLHPGFGGTARLTRLIAAPRAMELMLSGRTIDARQAQRLGLVDAVADANGIEALAGRAVLGETRGRPPRPWLSLYNAGPARRLLGASMRRRLGKSVPFAENPAPYALIDLWVRFGGARAQMIEAEAASFARLVAGEVAQARVRTFFERGKRNSDRTRTES
jgi:3-hydroxyacyl-CoA dehydrogenase/enoyl-CoA hydratase/3-hydroxybutyryl-CoA epimerase